MVCTEFDKFYHTTIHHFFLYGNRAVIVARIRGPGTCYLVIGIELKLCPGLHRLPRIRVKGVAVKIHLDRQGFHCRVSICYRRGNPTFTVANGHIGKASGQEQTAVLGGKR